MNNVKNRREAHLFLIRDREYSFLRFVSNFMFNTDEFNSLLEKNKEVINWAMNDGVEYHSLRHTIPSDIEPK